MIVRNVLDFVRKCQALFPVGKKTGKKTGSGFPYCGYWENKKRRTGKTSSRKGAWEIRDRAPILLETGDRDSVNRGQRSGKTEDGDGENILTQRRKGMVKGKHERQKYLRG